MHKVFIRAIVENFTRSVNIVSVENLSTINSISLPALKDNSTAVYRNVKTTRFREYLALVAFDSTGNSWRSSTFSEQWVCRSLSHDGSRMRVAGRGR